MGTVGSRPSCLGEKSPQSEDFLKDSYLRGVGLEAGRTAGGKNNAAGGTPLSQRVIENGWSPARLGAPSKDCPSSPLPKRNNVDVDMQAVGASCHPLKARLELGAWGATPCFRSSGDSWAWKASSSLATAATEVTEVTEVTETVVTEIVEVTEYPGGDRSRQPVVTRTVKVLAESAGGTLPELPSEEEKDTRAAATRQPRKRWGSCSTGSQTWKTWWPARNPLPPRPRSCGLSCRSRSFCSA